MHWLTDIFCQPGHMQAILILALICMAGLALAKFKIRGIQLGVTFVFFCGIVAGEILDHCGVQMDWRMIALAQNFGLIVFVYTLGLQVGPGFFPSLKKGGIRLNLLGLLTILLTTLTSIGIYAFTDISFPDSMGLLCGAATNTPMLGAAQQSLLDAHPDQAAVANSMATACAIGYPFGVIGVLASMIIFNAASRGKAKSHPVDPSGDTYVAEFHVSNPAVFGKSLSQLNELHRKSIIVSRLWRDGKVSIPQGSTELRNHDHLLAVLHKADVEWFRTIFGDQESTDWNRPDIDWNNIDSSGFISRHVLVTRNSLNGVKIGALHLRSQFNINITRVNRAGIQLVASPNMRLQLGDRLTVVGDAQSISKVAEILGNEQKELNNPNLLALFIGLFLGAMLGCVPFFIPGMSTAVKLGVAGGPIVVGILMGAFGPRIHLSTYTTRSANLMLRQMGLVIYLACLGLSAGAGFFEKAFSMQGLLWISMALLIATVPVIICGWIASRFCKLDYAQNAGMLCAAMANPIALTYANANSDEQEASEAYATVYPLSMFVRVISAQLLMLLF